MTGNLEVICGSMFSGKSEELIRRMRRAIFGQKNVQIFKHSLDDRNSLTSIFSHNGEKINAIPVSTVDNLSDSISQYAEVIGIDEVQFFDKSIILFLNKLVQNGKRVVVAGLDLDFRGIPFGPMPYLLALADEVTKLKAVCVKNGKDAHYTQRIVNGHPASYKDPIILVGAKNFYEARSRECFEIDRIPLEEYLNIQNI